MLIMPSQIQTLEKMPAKAECNAALDQPCRAPMRFIPSPKKKFPAELRIMSSATTIDVLSVF